MAAVAVVWAFPYLPMTDLPEHMLGARVLTESASPLYAPFYTVRFPWNGYSSFFLFAMAVHPIASVPLATKLYISIALLLTIGALGYWIRTFAFDRCASALPAVVLLFGGFFQVGMIHFLFSAPFLFFGLGFSHRLLEDKHPRGWIQAGLALSLVIAYLSHIVTFVIAILAMALTAVTSGNLKRAGRLLVPALPATMLLVAYLLVAPEGEAPPLTFGYDPLPQRIATLWTPFGVFKDSLSDTWIWDWPIPVCVLSAALLALLTRSVDAQPRARTAWMVAAFFAVSAVALPSHVGGGFLISIRAAYFAALAAVAALPSGWQFKRWSTWTMFSICLIPTAAFAVRAYQFQAPMQALDRAIDAIPSGRIIQPVITDPHTDSSRTYPLLHAAAWYSYAKGGASPYLFAATTSYFPVRTKQPFATKAPGEWRMAEFRYAEHGIGSDYFLVKTGNPGILADLRRNVPLLRASGPWMVFGPNPGRR